MNASVEFYQKEAQASLSNIPWLAQMQTDALAELHRSGFPTRHDEDWKYTTLDYLLQNNFKQNRTSTAAAHPHSDLPFTAQVSIDNGHVRIVGELPKDVLIMPLSQALNEHSSLVQTHLDKVLQGQHAFHYLNTAMLQLGVFIYIPAHVRLHAPVVISHYQDEDQQALHLRHLIVAQEHSELSVIEEYRGKDACAYFTNSITEIVLQPHAQVTHYKIQNEGLAACHLGHIAVQQKEHSAFASHSISLGGKLVRSDLSIYLEQEYAQCLMNGIYMPNAGQHVDHHTTVYHLVPNGTSAQDYKGILQGNSRAVFNGKVIVAKNAQHTNASQQNKNILLSANSEIDTKPQLEIFADDVICSHGATVGQLDEDALFYLATRGIDREEASKYLIRAFVEDNLRLITQSQVADWLANVIAQRVG